LDLKLLIADDSGEYDRFGILLQESKKFCKRVGLQTDLVSKIIKTNSDWAFVLKVDALPESERMPLISKANDLTLSFQSVSDRLTLAVLRSRFFPRPPSNYNLSHGFKSDHSRNRR
jgi:hypothetical protein